MLQHFFQPSCDPENLQNTLFLHLGTQKMGDDVLVKTDGYLRPCAARVKNIYVDKTGEGQLDIHWYYEPEHTEQKTQEWMAEKEIFISELKDTISVETVAWTCAVLPMEKYVAYLNFEADREGAPHVIGPVAPDEHFNPNIDLKACKDLKYCKLPKESANNSRKRKREGHSENTDAQQGVNDAENAREKENGAQAHTGTTPAQAGAGHAQSDQQEGEEADENQQNEQIEDSSSEGEEDAEDDDEDEEDWENQVFMCRGVGAGGEYDGARNGFISCHIPVYCKCGPPQNEQPGLPYNPDKSMVQCKECTDWFHYECKAMKLTQIEIDNIAAGHLYVCPVCKDSAGDINQAWTDQGDEGRFADEN